MKDTRLLMGMPITLEIVDKEVSTKDIDDVFAYFVYIDNTFSIYKENSEISRINRKEIIGNKMSYDMQTIFQLAEKTKQETHGYFDIAQDNGLIDPSGVVKGWAILHAANLLKEKGFKNYYVDAGGDIQVSGLNSKGKPWTVGIRNPFNHDEIVKTVHLKGHGIATSGTYIRGQHIYNPLNRKKNLT
ncbi:MAG: FAD:protein FMN transferase, partial [Patescibacteria group bacterium]|nr:FAD:protein FMN transferase [Patescibacteria group bacterium]